MLAFLLRRRILCSEREPQFHSIASDWMRQRVTNRKRLPSGLAAAPGSWKLNIWNETLATLGWRRGPLAKNDADRRFV